MKEIKEHYRKFELSRLIYQSAEAPASSSESPEDSSESTETQSPDESDITTEIQTRHDTVKTEITEIQKSYKGKDHENRANEFAKKMNAHAEQEFGKLQKEYKAAKEKAETNDNPDYSQITTKADTLKDQILARLKSADEYIESEYGNLDKIDSTEVGLINALEIKKNGDDPNTIEEIFGENLAHIISMSCVIKEIDGTLMIKKNGEQNDKRVELKSAKDLKAFLPQDMQGNFETMINVVEKGKTNGIDVFKSQIKAQKLTMENVQEIQDIMDSNPDQFKEMGFMEFFATLGEIWTMIQEALETKDFTTLHDVLIDIQEGRKPGERLTQTKESYNEILEKEDDVNILLEYYNDPHGELANKAFSNLPYRTSIKALIRLQIGTALKVEIGTDGINKIPGEKAVKIIALKGNQTFEITIEKNKVSMQEVKINNEGLEVREPKESELKEFNGLSKGENCLAAKLFQIKPVEEVTTQPEEEEEEEEEGEEEEGEEEEGEEGGVTIDNSDENVVQNTNEDEFDSLSYNDELSESVLNAINDRKLSSNNNEEGNYEDA